MRTPSRTVLPWLAACALALLATGSATGLYEYSDAELTGPEQPIAFSHLIHAGNPQDGGLGIQCLYCHTGAQTSQHATIPAVSVCMGCHQWVKQGRSEGSAEEIAKIHEAYCGQKQCPLIAAPGSHGTSIAWIRIHNMPEYVQFKHHRHVRAGVQCQECHGPVETMKRVYLTPDTVYRWPHSLGLPAAKLEMGWCVECHQARGASIDCVACHY